MKDKLKDFIETHRSAFETNELPESLWHQLEARLDTAGSKPDAKILPLGSSRMSQALVFKLAAAVLLLLVAGLGTYILVREKQFSQLAAGQRNPQPAATENISPELRQAETYYTRLISEKQTQLRQLDPQEANYCTLDMQALDKEYTELKKQLLQDANNEQITDALLRNLQIRMQILNRQLEALQKLKKQQTSQPLSHEKTTL